MKTFWLNVHRPYACRHSLACCSSGWPIPIERDRAARVEREIAAGRVHPFKTPWLIPDSAAPAEMAGMLAVGPSGKCGFLKAEGRQPNAVGSCSIYSTRPMSCVHFPYICLVDQRGVHVTLSHYCPTAASLLFDHQGPIEIVEGPSPIPELDIAEGFDARDSLPPLAKPGRLMSDDEFTEWETEEVRRCGSAGVRSCDGVNLRLFDAARAAVPPTLWWPDAPEDTARTWAERVEPKWDSFAPVVNRYLTARLFASWAAYRGDGIRSILEAASTADAVLRVETVRQCVGANRALDSFLLKEAIRRSDLLLVHYADWR